MKRRTQLVCQHLENISRQALERHQNIIGQYARGRQGIYALYRRGKLYYVGLATNLRNRLKQHLKDRHGGSWDQFSVYLTVGDNHLRELEALMLRTVKPSGNKQKGKFAKSEDLRRRFRRDIKKCVLSEMDGLFGFSRKEKKSPKLTLKKSMMGAPRRSRNISPLPCCYAPDSRAKSSPPVFVVTEPSVLTAKSTPRRLWPPHSRASAEPVTAGPSGSMSAPRVIGWPLTNCGGSRVVLSENIGQLKMKSSEGQL